MGLPFFRQFFCRNYGTSFSPTSHLSDSHIVEKKGRLKNGIPVFPTIWFVGTMGRSLVRRAITPTFVEIMGRVIAPTFVGIMRRTIVPTSCDNYAARFVRHQQNVLYEPGTIGGRSWWYGDTVSIVPKLAVTRHFTQVISTFLVDPSILNELPKMSLEYYHILSSGYPFDS